jgi:hypothetical protein
MRKRSHRFSEEETMTVSSSEMRIETMIRLDGAALLIKG